MKRVSRLIVTHPRGISIRNPNLCAWAPIKLPHHYGKRHYFPLEIATPAPPMAALRASTGIVR